MHSMIDLMCACGYSVGVVADTSLDQLDLEFRPSKRRLARAPRYRGVDASD